jgi:putative inorganic carbon (HCO3(-)) transporter
MEKGLIVTYLLTYGGALCSLFNPFIGLLIYICFAIIKPESLWHWSVPEGNYSRIIAIALLTGWFFNGLGNLDFRSAGSIVVSVVGYWLWMVFAALHSPHGDPDWPYVESIAKVVIAVVVGITLVDSIAKVRQVAWIILLCQGYLAFEWNLSYFEGVNRLQDYGFAGMDNNSVAIGLVTVAGLGFFLAIETPRWWAKGLAFVLTGLIIHAIMFSFSRGALLGLIATGVVAFVVLPKRPIHYGLFGLVVLFGLMAAGPEVRARFATAFTDQEERDASAQNRLDYWGYCVDIIQEEPVLGIGPRQFADSLPSRYGRTRAEAHNLWLQTGAELGIPGLAFLLGFYGICVTQMWRIVRNKHPAHASSPHLASMVFTAITGFFVSAQFVSLSGLEVPYYIVLAATGLIKLETGSRNREAVSENSVASSALIV